MTTTDDLAAACPAWFEHAARADQSAVLAHCADLAQAFAADPDSDAAWAQLPAAQWAAEVTGLTGYASLFNAALPAALAPAVAGVGSQGLPGDVPGAWAARMDPGVDAGRRAVVDALLETRAADWRAERGLPDPDPCAPDAATAFPPGFMAALTRLRQAALPVAPRSVSAVSPAEEDDAPRPARPLAELLDRLFELEDLQWRRPATPQQIATLEAKTGMSLPADYRAFLERANGSKDREFSGAHEVAADARELLGYAEEVADAEDPAAMRASFTNDDGSGRVASGGFVRGWLPVYDVGTGDFVILDCAPGLEGRVGQILQYGTGETRVTHPDFRSWLQDHVEELEL